MTNQLDLLAGLLQENYEHARLHEEHRTSCTNFVMAIAAGLLAIGSQALAKPWVATSFGVLTMAVGAYGALLVLKHFERYAYQLKVASVLRDAIETAIKDPKPVPSYSEILEAARKQHFQADIFRPRKSSQAEWSDPNAWLKRLRLNKLYLAINIIVVTSGIAFIVIAWLV